MLVLSRKIDEKIVIGQDIVLTVVEIDRGKVRLGIEAPRNVPIFREELLPALLPDGEINLDSPLPPLHAVDGRIPCPACGQSADLIDEPARCWQCPHCQHVWTALVSDERDTGGNLP